MKLLLVSGFLGSGKTTFIRNLLASPQWRGAALIINEFGRTGTDGALLQGESAALCEIAGGSMFCTCKSSELTDAVARMRDMGAQKVIAEASGFADPSGARELVENTGGVEYCGCVGICDAPRVHKYLVTSRAADAQLRMSGLILLNKTDLVSEQEMGERLNMLRERFAFARVEPTIMARIEPLWLETLTYARKCPPNPQRDITLQRAEVIVSESMTRQQCLSLLKLVAPDTYRMKGFVKLQEGMFRADCVGESLELVPCKYEGASALTVLAGAGMQMRRALREAREWYPDIMEIRWG